MPSNGNGDYPPTTSVPDLSSSSDAPQDSLPLASRPERPAAPPSAPEVAQLAPALEDILRSLDESALTFHPDDDEHDDDEHNKDEEEDHVDPEDDRPLPSRRTSTAVKRAKEKMAKQRRVIKSKLKALKGGEVNPTGASPFLVIPNSMCNPPRIVNPDAKTLSFTFCAHPGGPLLPILRATYTFLAPYLLSLLKFLSLPLTIPLNFLLSLLLLPWRFFQWIWQLVAPLAMLLGGFALVGVLCGASGAAVLRLWTWTFTPAADDGQAGEGSTRDEKGKGREEGRGGGRWSIPTKVRRRSAR